jgi:hypothetical protein
MIESGLRFAGYSLSRQGIANRHSSNGCGVIDSDTTSASQVMMVGISFANDVDMIMMTYGTWQLKRHEEGGLYSD